MKRHVKGILCLMVVCAMMASLNAQSAFAQLGEPIHLKQPSFEEKPYVGTRHGGGPNGWYDCGHPNETAPDVHPAGTDTAFFEVVGKASDGDTYLGMVVRDNSTWEAIGQRLRTPLEGGQCYNFSIDLSRSKKYVSLSRTTDETVNYGRAAVFRFWGGNGMCSRLELLDMTEMVENYDWRTYNLRLEPSRNYSFIVLEVFYKTPVMFEYSGNMLLDNASDIIPVPCDEAPKPAIEEPKEELIASNTVSTPAEKTPGKKNKPGGGEKAPDKGVTKKPTKTKKEYVKELDEDLVIGQQITLKKLYFDADSSSLAKRYFPIVDDVYYFLKENKKMIIEIGGHTNNRCEDVFCNSLSEKRAKSVANYLINKGIQKRRVSFKGYGKMNPKYPNNTPANRRRNQRVEIKILSKNG